LSWDLANIIEKFSQKNRPQSINDDYPYSSTFSIYFLISGDAQYQTRQLGLRAMEVQE
jgi:hypothetical protein